MPLNIFVINPGSTSTKLAVFSDTECVFDKNIRHDSKELKKFYTVTDQFEYRYLAVKEAAMEANVEIGSMDAFAGRGGLLKPLPGGVYVVNEIMLDDLKNARYGNHASNLGAMLANKFASEYGKAAYVVDPPVVDELMTEARLTGLPGIKRTSVFHALNQKASAIRAANEMGMDYNKVKLIVAHLGGGISVGAHDLGRIVDVNNGLEEGPFSPERAGSLPVGQLVELCFSGNFSKDQIKKMLVGEGGLVAYAGTTDLKAIEIEAKTDENMKKLLDTMIYRISCEICSRVAALCGRVDRIIITGGLANSSYLVEGIKRRVSFLSPIIVYPGEDEMKALAEGVIRVLSGNESVLQYD